MNKLLALLQEELQKFVLRMAAEFPNRKEQLIFLINNYDMMLAVLKVRIFATPLSLFGHRFIDSDSNR